MSQTGIDFKLERKQSQLVHDSRSLFQQLRSAMAGEAPVVVMAAFALLFFVVPGATEVLAVLAYGFAWYVRWVQKTSGLSLRMPKTSGELDPKEVDVGTNKAKPAEGIVFLGNDMDTGEEVWLTDTQARTHMLFMGTTGSGKTEYLLSLVYNSLIHGSGMIYVDGKADSSLYGKLYSMARAMGREDDVLVINFQTGAKDIYGAQPNKLSNTLNPFANGSSGMLSELVKGLMATGEKSTWTQQAESFVEALMKPLVYLRDNHGMLLDVNVIRQYFELNKLEDLAWMDGDKYPGLESSGVLDGLHNYLLTKPAYKREKYHDQSETTNEQHGYITMQLIRTFNSLSDTYGYIMKTPLAEIDFVDVFLNRRILVVLLPALEKSPSELTNLGRIVVASIKATMAKGLGSALEGRWKKVIDAKPTTAPSYFPCVLDEYGYYAVEGFAVVPAQARSLGFSAIFAGQDLPAFEKSSKPEAESTLANTNTRFCGKLECTKTYQFFKDIAGQGKFTSMGRYEVDTDTLGPNKYKHDTSVSVDRIDRVGFEDLRGQLSGQWHVFFANSIIRVKSFYANPKPVQTLRVNHFIRVARPDAAEITAFKGTFEKFTRAVVSEGGLMSYMDRVSSPSDIADIHEAFDMFKGDSPLLRAGKVLAYCAQAEDRRSRAFANMNVSDFETGVQQLDDDATIDFAAQMGAHQPRGYDDDTGFVEPAPEASQRQGLFADQYPRATPKDNLDPFASTPIARDEDEEPAYRPAPMALDMNQPDEFEEPTEASPGAEWDIGGPMDNEAKSGSGNYDFEEPVSATRGALLPHTLVEEGHAQTSVFGSEIEAPASVANAGNDVDLDSADLPASMSDTGDDEFTFDAPLADEGLLNLEATVSGIAAVERVFGATESEAHLTASAVAESLAASTKYPLSPPAKVPTIDKFESLARRLSHILSESTDAED
jgi:intracellular multiplication protein IcmO